MNSYCVFLGIQTTIEQVNPKKTTDFVFRLNYLALIELHRIFNKSSFSRNTVRVTAIGFLFAFLGFHENTGIELTFIGFYWIQKRFKWVEWVEISGSLIGLYRV